MGILLPLRDRSLIIWRGAGKLERGGGTLGFTPTKRGKRFSHAEGGGAHKVGGSFNTGARSFNHTEGGAKCFHALKGGA